MNKFDITSLNFENRSIGYFVVVKFKKSTPFYFLKCNGARPSDYKNNPLV
jgi:hypothetical protein